MKLWTKSPVWQYFGLAVDEDRKIKSDDLPCTVPTWNFLPVTLVSNKLFKKLCMDAYLIFNSVAIFC